MVFALHNAHKGMAMAIFLISALLVPGERAEAAKQTELRPIRATVGSVEVRNWENNLVKYNPNLRHYHWNPIYANVQGTRLVGPPPRPQQRLTTRPKKETLPVKGKKQASKVDNRNYIYRPVQERRSVYKNPTKIAPQRNNTGTQLAYKHVTPTMSHTSTSLGYQHAAPQLSSRDLNGRVSPGQQPMTATDAELRRKALMAKLDPRQLELNARPAAMGNMAVKSVNGTLSHSNCSGQLASKEVEAQLVAKATEAKLVEPAVAQSYAPYNRTDSGSRRVTKTVVNAKVRAY